MPRFSAPSVPLTREEILQRLGVQYLRDSQKSAPGLSEKLDWFLANLSLQDCIAAHAEFVLSISLHIEP